MLSGIIKYCLKNGLSLIKNKKQLKLIVIPVTLTEKYFIHSLFDIFLFTLNVTLRFANQVNVIAVKIEKNRLIASLNEKCMR